MRRWLLCLASLSFSLSLAAAPSQPHIVFVFADDLGWNQIGKRAGVSNLHNDHASEYYLTPEINRLAEMGMTFNRAYAAPNCAPARAALHTGVAASRHGITSVFNRGPSGANDNQNGIALPDNPVELDASFTTLAETLKSAGYTTGHFGKWHIGLYSGANAAQNQGFDINVAGAGNERSSLTENTLYHADGLGQWLNGDLIKPPKVEGGSTTTFTRTPGEHMSDALTDEAHTWMAAQVAANPNTPVFLYLAHHATHSPIDPLASDTSAIPGTSTDPRHDRQAFGGLLYGMDRSVGDLLDYLENNNDDQGDPLIDNTIFIFYSDNGGEDNNLTGRMSPLRGAKGGQFEGGVRVPCFISTPAMRAAGQADTATDQAVHVQDFHATLSALAGATAPAGLDGVDFSQVLIDPANTFSRDIFEWWLQRRTDVGEATATLHRGNMKLIWYPFEALNPDLSARFDLFDVANDLSETTDLSDDPAYEATLHEMANVIGDKLVTDGTPLPQVTASASDVPLPTDFYAYDDTAQVGHASAVVIDVLVNDWDPDGVIDPTTVQVVGAASEGTTSVNPTTGVITYTHSGNNLNPDSFTYTFETTGAETSNEATVSISIQVGWDGETSNDLGVSTNWSPNTAPSATTDFLVDNNNGFTGANADTLSLTTGNTNFRDLEISAAGTTGDLRITSGSSFGRFLMSGDLIFSGSSLTGVVNLDEASSSLSWAATGGNRSILNHTTATVVFGETATFDFMGWQNSSRQLTFGGTGDFILGPNTTFRSGTGVAASRLTLVGTAPGYGGTVTLQDGMTFTTGGGAGLRNDGGVIKIEGTDTIAADEAVGFGTNAAMDEIREIDVSGLDQTSNSLAQLASFADVGSNRLTVDADTALEFTDLRIPTGNVLIDLQGWVEGQSSLIFTDLGGTFYDGTVAEGEAFVDLTIDGAPAYMTQVADVNGDTVADWAVRTGTVVVDGAFALAGNDLIGDAVGIELAGGTLATNGFGDTVDTLSVSAASAIDLSGGGSLAFADSSGETWTGTVDLAGPVGPTSLRFGTDASGLTPTQKRNILINGNYVELDASGYVVPLTTTDTEVSGDQSGTDYRLIGGVTLSGDGTAGGVEARTLSTVAPGTGATPRATLNVSGDFSAELGSVLEIGAIRSAGLFDNDRVAASGTVNFAGTIDLYLEGEDLQSGDEIEVATGTVPLRTYREVPAQVVVDPASPAPLPAGLELKVVYYSDKITVLAQTASIANVLRNPDFDHGMFFWDTIGPRNGVVSTFSTDPADPQAGKNSLKIDISTAGTNSWADLQILQNFLAKAGDTYTVSFKVKASAPTSMSWSVGNTKLARDFTNPNINGFSNFGVNIGTSWQTISQTFTPAETDSAALSLIFGQTAAGAVWVDDVKVTTTGAYPPVASEFTVLGYIPAYRFGASDLIKTNPEFFKNIDVLVYGFIMTDANGALLQYYQQAAPGSTQWDYTQDIEDTLQTIKTDYGLELLVAIGGGGVDETVFFDNVLSDSGKRTTLINNLIAFCNDEGFDGVDLDYEYAAAGTNQQENYELFVEEAKTAFTGAKTGGGDLALTAAVDTFSNAYYPPDAYLAHRSNHMMNYAKDYDAHVTNIFQLFNAGAPMASIFPGIEWSTEGTATIPYRSLLQTYDPARHDTTAGGYVFNGIDGTARKILLARALGCGGVMIWEFGHDVEDSAQSLIRNALEDADDDAMLDEWEDDFSGGLNLRPLGDDDRDGLFNLWENLTRTDPLDGSSREAPEVSIVDLSGADYFAIQFPYVNPERIDLFAEGSLDLSGWTTLETDPAEPGYNAEASEAGGTLTIRQTNPIGSPGSYPFVRTTVQAEQ